MKKKHAFPTNSRKAEEGATGGLGNSQGKEKRKEKKLDSGDKIRGAERQGWWSKGSRHKNKETKKGEQRVGFRQDSKGCTYNFVGYFDKMADEN